LIREDIVPADCGRQQIRGGDGARQFGQGFDFLAAETAFHIHCRSP
jgi:hypothetical protein